MEAFFEKAFDLLKVLLIGPFFYSVQESEISFGTTAVLAILGLYLAKVFPTPTLFKLLVGSAVLVVFLGLHYVFADAAGIFLYRMVIRAFFSAAFGFMVGSLFCALPKETQGRTTRTIDSFDSRATIGVLPWNA